MLFLHVAPPLPIKPLAPWLWEGESTFGHGFPPFSTSGAEHRSTVDGLERFWQEDSAVPTGESVGAGLPNRVESLRDPAFKDLMVKEGQKKLSLQEESKVFRGAFPEVQRRCG